MEIKTEIKKITPTITNLFFVITTGVKREDLDSNNFINAYIGDVNLDIQYKNSVYLLFKPVDRVKFRQFLDSERERTSSLVEDYDYKNGYTVVVYTLDMRWKEDFGMIKTGKYSHTSKPFQLLFPRVKKMKVNGLHRDELSLQFRIFNRTPDLIKHWEKEFSVDLDEQDEVWDGWNEEREILNIDNL